MDAGRGVEVEAEVAEKGRVLQEEPLEVEVLLLDYVQEFQQFELLQCEVFQVLFEK